MLAPLEMPAFAPNATPPPQAAHKMVTIRYLMMCYIFLSTLRMVLYESIGGVIIDSTFLLVGMLFLQEDEIFGPMAQMINALFGGLCASGLSCLVPVYLLALTTSVFGMMRSMEYGAVYVAKCTDTSAHLKRGLDEDVLMAHHHPLIDTAWSHRFPEADTIEQISSSPLHLMMALANGTTAAAAQHSSNSSHSDWMALDGQANATRTRPEAAVKHYPPCWVVIWLTVVVSLQTVVLMGMACNVRGMISAMNRRRRRHRDPEAFGDGVFDYFDDAEANEHNQINERALRMALRISQRQQHRYGGGPGGAHGGGAAARRATSPEPVMGQGFEGRIGGAAPGDAGQATPLQMWSAQVLLDAEAVAQVTPDDECAGDP